MGEPSDFQKWLRRNWLRARGRDPDDPRPTTYLDWVRGFASFLAPFWLALIVLVGWTLIDVFRAGVPDDS